MGFTPIDESEIATSSPSFNFTPISENDIATAPSTAGNMLSDTAGYLWQGVKNIPSAITGMISDIPAGIDNVSKLPAELITGALDVGNLGYSKLTGQPFIPQGLSSSDNEIIRKKLSGQTLTPEEDARRAIIKDSLIPEAAATRAASEAQAERTLKGVGNIGMLSASTAVAPTLAAPLAGSAGSTLFEKLLQVTGIDPTTAPQEDYKNLVENTGTFAGLQALGGVANKGLKAIGKSLEPVSPETVQIQSLKPTPTEFAKIEGALPGLEKRGVFTGKPGIENIESRNNAAIKSISDQLHGPEGVLSIADSLQKDVQIPDLSKARELIKGDVNEMVLNRQLNRRAKWLNDNWDGTISDLSRLKSKLYKSAYRNASDSAVLDRVIAEELKTSIETQAESLSPGLGRQVKDLNSQLGDHLSILNVIERNINKEGAAQLKPTKPSSLSNIFNKTVQGGMTGGVGGVLLTATGLSGGATLPAAIVGGTLLGGAAALRNPTIANLLSKTAKLGSDVLDVGSNPQTISTTLAPSFLSNIQEPTTVYTGPNAESNSKLSELLGKTTGVEMGKADDFLSKEEGGQRLKAYYPNVKGSGVTVGTGVDLGNRTKSDLQSLGISDSLVSKISPYLGKKDTEAKDLLKSNPLNLTRQEAEELDQAVKSDIFSTVSNKLESSAGIKLDDLPEEAQTVVKSLAYNFGAGLDKALPTIWKAIGAQDWGRVQDLLVNTKWKQSELAARRRREAELLGTLV